MTKPWERAYAQDTQMAGPSSDDRVNVLSQEYTKTEDPELRSSLKREAARLGFTGDLGGGQAPAPAAPKPWERQYATEAPAPAPVAPAAPQESAGGRILKGALKGVADLTSGAAKVGANILAPYDLLQDVVTGNYGHNRARMDAANQLAKEHGANDWTSGINQSVPEMIVTGGPLAGVEGAVAKEVAGKALPKVVQKLAPGAADIAANTALAASQAAAEGKDVGDAAKWAAGGSAAGRVAAKVLGKTMEKVGGAFQREMSPEARLLIQEGIQPTPGQAYGGTVARVEEAAKNLPFTGSTIERAQTNVHSGVLQRTMDDALAPIGGRVEGSGLKALDSAHEVLDQAYKDVVPRTYANTNDVHAAFSTVRQLLDDGAIPMLGKKERRQVGAYIDNKLAGLMDEVGQGQHIDGRLLKDLDIDIGKMERQYGGKDPALGEAFRTLKENIRGAYLGVDDQAISRLRDVNTAFRNMLPVRDALEKSLTAGGTPTPFQLRKALQKHGQETSDIIKAGAEVAPTRATHRPERLAIGSSLSLLGALAHPGIAMAGLGAGYLGSKAYSPTGIRMQMAALQRANAVGKGLAAGAQYADPRIASQIGREWSQ